LTIAAYKPIIQLGDPASLGNIPKTEISKDIHSLEHTKAQTRCPEEARPALVEQGRRHFDSG
jgi:hypothetical protein